MIPICLGLALLLGQEVRISARPYAPVSLRVQSEAARSEGLHGAGASLWSSAACGFPFAKGAWCSD
jgi:hypothetical protein